MRILIPVGATALMLTSTEATLPGWGVIQPISFHLPSMPSFDDMMKNIGNPFDSLFKDSGDESQAAKSGMPSFFNTDINNAFNQMEHQMEEVHQMNIANIDKAIAQMAQNIDNTLDQAINGQDEPGFSIQSDVIEALPSTNTAMPTATLVKEVLPAVTLGDDDNALPAEAPATTTLPEQVQPTRVEPSNAGNPLDALFQSGMHGSLDFFNHIFGAISNSFGSVSNAFKTSISDFAEQIHSAFPNTPIHVQVIEVHRRPDYLPEVCVKPALTFCKSKMFNGEYQARMCLLDNMIQLTPDCMHHIMTHTTFADRCYFDIDIQCKPVRWSYEMSKDCIKKRVNEVAPICASFVSPNDLPRTGSFLHSSSQSTPLLAQHQASVDDGVWRETNEAKTNAYTSTNQSSSSSASTEDTLPTTLAVVGGVCAIGAISLIAAFVVTRRKKRSRRSFYIDATSSNSEQRQPILSYDPEREELV